MGFRKLWAIWLWLTLIYIFVLQSVHTLPALGICMATSFTLRFVLGSVLNTAWLSFQADFSCNNRSNVSVALLVVPLGTWTSDTLQGSSSYYSVWILWPVWKQWNGSPSWEAYSGSVDQEIFAWYGTRSFSIFTRFIWELKQPFEAHFKLTYYGY
jgi:hypothetical protein